MQWIVVSVMGMKTDGGRKANVADGAEGGDCGGKQRRDFYALRDCNLEDSREHDDSLQRYAVDCVADGAEGGDCGGKQRRGDKKDASITKNWKYDVIPDMETMDSPPLILLDKCRMSHGSADLKEQQPETG
ncbi:hypothetical protein L2E82_35316 [Cichorium intybus]|uniref:Uncharacterized protein n=1 Tax=Cichorium intybus TaxID=13427 RepID=A0ACB9BNN1_CICIN|nr:hypothetical protein L2E82_35316 [Cichorium intybus]